MDLRVVINLSLLTLATFIVIEARAEGSRSVVFFDAPENGYIRGSQLDPSGKMSSISMDEVAATILVLLGLSPPPLFSAESSEKLNKVLLPNPFDRPHAVFVMDVGGVDDHCTLDLSNFQVGNTFNSRIGGSGRAEIELPGEAEVSVVHLDEDLGVECDAVCLDKELQNLAHFWGGSYTGSLESLDGDLTVLLSSGTTLNLHVAKKADLKFALSFVSLVKNIKKAVEIHEDLSEGSVSQAELLIGHFRGIEALEAEYGPGNIVDHGVELLHATIFKLYDLLQRSYGGKIVGVLSCNNGPQESKATLVEVFSTPASRWLQEGSPHNGNSSEVLLVRRTLVWITGVILLVSTLIGVYFLLNMPLTRDTLLYSNVKMD